MIYLRNIFLFLLLFSFTGNAQAQIISATRITDWTSPGSAPMFEVKKSVTLTSFDADPSGTYANDSALLRAIRALNGAGEIFIPMGLYLFEQEIILPDSTILRGENDTETSKPMTILKLQPGENKHGIKISGGEDTAFFKMSYAPRQGSKKLYVPNPGNYKASAFIRLKAMDDAGLLNNSWAYGSTGQIFQIIRIEDDSLILNKPVRKTYSMFNTPRLIKFKPKTQVHIQCLIIEREKETSSQTANIYFNRAANCSVRGVESRFSNHSHIDLVQSTQITIENSHFINGHSYGSGGKAYGVLLEFGTGDCYVHQNNFEHLRHSVILQAGANGNVIAYNYSVDPYWTGVSLPSDAAGDLVLHGNYPYFNLFEGNVVQNVVIDNTHGVNGHFNTFYRNRIQLYGIFMNAFPASDKQNFIGNQIINTTNHSKGLYNLRGLNHFEYGNLVKGKVRPPDTREPSSSSLFDYDFGSFYQHVSSVPPLGFQNWLTLVPRIETEYRFRASGQSSICGNIRYDRSFVIDPADFLPREFDVYPNPFSDFFYLKNRSDVADFKVIIRDLYGKTIYSATMSGELNTINPDNINSGMYILTIEGFEKKSVKLIKK